MKTMCEIPICMLIIFIAVIVFIFTLIILYLYLSFCHLKYYQNNKKYYIITDENPYSSVITDI